MSRRLRGGFVLTSRASSRGMSLMELLVVLAIMLILTAGIITGYSNMRRAQNLTRANEKLLSTLILTRNLAISNNSVAYLEIVGTDLVGQTDPTIAGQDGSKQILKIHLFPNPADALTVTGEPAPNTTTPNTLSSTPPNLVVLATNAWNPTKNKNWVEPGSIPYVSGVAVPGYGMTYTNYTPEQLYIEPGTQIGVHPAVLGIDGTGTAPILIGFNSDGTLVNAAQTKLYVTDDIKHLYGPGAETSLETIINTKHEANPHLKVIDVFGGGMIKQEF